MIPQFYAVLVYLGSKHKFGQTLIYNLLESALYNIYKGEEL